MARKLSCLVAAVAAVALVVAAGPAWGHQIASNNGVAVQTHVDPNDEPIAGQASTIWVVRVKGKSDVFSWKTCRCHLKVFDSSGAVLFDCSRHGPEDTGDLSGGGGVRIHVLGTRPSRDESEEREARQEMAPVQGDVRHPSRAIGVDRLSRTRRQGGYDE